MHRFAPLAFVVCGSLLVAACRVEHENATPPPAVAPPVATAPPAPACTAVGLWNFQGPNGSGDQVEIRQGDTPTSYVIHHTNAAMATTNTGAYSQQDMKVELGATGGAAACQMAADCSAMNCTIAGQPVVIRKLGS